jgi:hypothetical protein
MEKPALAHRPSDSTLTLRPWEGKGWWDIAVRDLHHALGLDENGDGSITWGEIGARRPAIAQYALDRLTLSVPNGPCPTEITNWQMIEHADGPYVRLHLSLACPDPAHQLTIGYRLFFEKDPFHRGMARVLAGGEQTLLFSPTTSVHTLDLGRSKVTIGPLMSFVGEGIWHIFIGLDHILFLLALLLPSVFRQQAGQRAPVRSLREALPDVIRIVTGFTLAHSLTLGLATLGVVQIPARLAETAIAITVVLAALHNLWPILGTDRWIMAFALGLVHGFGFSSVLGELDLGRGSLVASLMGFNLGVEIGQLALVFLFLPLAFALRRTRSYRRVVLVGGSLAVAAIGSLWFLERAFDLTLVAQFISTVAFLT